VEEFALNDARGLGNGANSPPMNEWNGGKAYGKPEREKIYGGRSEPVKDQFHRRMEHFVL